MPLSNAKKKLNPAQRKAVETIFGPVLAVAGPGTGKTQVLALRIAEILEKTDTSPQNILALTFTDAGVVAMRNRLRQFLGAEANSVPITTFHGFCCSVIERFPEKFLFAKALETADEVVKIQRLQQILKAEKLEHLGSLAAPNSYLNSILSAISFLKREGISVTEFEEIAKREKEEFDAIPEEEKLSPKTQKRKSEWVQKEKKIHKWRELAIVFRRYESGLRMSGLMDFDDQILFVLRALSKDEALLSEIQEECHFLLCDEFQDSNGAQMKLLELLVGDDAEANIFAVGDDDQSIYRFQGANLENILHFLRLFPNTKIVPLLENYRSTPEILAASQSTIEYGNERLTKKISTLEKRLHANRPRGQKPQLRAFSSADAEIYFLMQEIARKQKAGEKLSEIAVLVRTNADGRALLEECERANIPAVFAARSNILRDPFVRQLLDLLRLCALPAEVTHQLPRALSAKINEEFFRVLHFSFWGLERGDIWKIWKRVREQRSTFLEASLFETETPSTEEEISPPFVRLSTIIGHVAEWQSERHNFSFAEWLSKVMTESGFLDFVLRQKTRLESLNHINSFFSEAKNLSRHSPNFSLEDFLENIALREEFNLSISETPLMKPTEVVTILTAHGSKGLEFETVFLMHCQHGKWGDRRPKNNLPLPESLLETGKKNVDGNEEERRLFFVGMTRAKKQLFLSYSTQTKSGKKASPSRFLDEIKREYLEEYSTEKEEEAVFKRLKAALFFVPQKIRSDEKKILRSFFLSDSFALSPTAFENYRECPRKFLYENVLRIPHIKSVTAVLGTALHFALEAIFLRFATEKPTLSSAKHFLRVALKKEILSPEENDRVKKEGDGILKKYFSVYGEKMEEAVATEMNFKNHRVQIGEARITGKIDKIEWTDKTAKIARVIDYKTTMPKSKNEICGTRETDKTNPRAGSMWRQLQFYFLLTHKNPRLSFVVREFGLDFLKENGNGFLKREIFEINEANTEDLRREIEVVWKKIHAFEFLDAGEKCLSAKGKGVCSYCDRFLETEKKTE